MRLRQRFLIMILGLVGMGCLAACNKTSEDIYPPTIEFSTPADGAHFSMGSDVPMRAKVTDDEDLEEAVLSVYLVSDDSLLWSNGGKTFANPTTITASYLVGVPAGNDLLVKLVAKDKAGNQTEDTLHIFAD